LTVGARALSKHSHRSSEGFWGNSSGTETYKNKLASDVANKIITECTYINLHILPQQEYIVELRVTKGYGMRWTVEGEFRGFLEPQMADGHSQKWRH
jgi:hypothetical protein